MALCYSTDKNTNASIQRDNKCVNEQDRRTSDQRLNAELKAQSKSGNDLTKYKHLSGREL